MTAGSPPLRAGAPGSAASGRKKKDRLAPRAFAGSPHYFRIGVRHKARLFQQRNRASSAFCSKGERHHARYVSSPARRTRSQYAARPPSDNNRRRSPVHLHVCALSGPRPDPGPRRGSRRKRAARLGRVWPGGASYRRAASASHRAPRLDRHQDHGRIGKPHRLSVPACIEAHRIAVHGLIDHGPQQWAIIAGG